MSTARKILLLTAAALLILSVGVVGCFVALRSLKPDLRAERAAFQTAIVTQEGYVTDGPAAVPPPDVLQLVKYPSAVGPLAAYITPPPVDRSKKHPAIIWAHGGFGGIGDWLWTPASPDNDQTGAAFRNGQFVVMYPSWRGENDNPGQFEMFYGEVDDLLAARDYVRGLPWVDPDRIYLVGHSTGATLVLLASTIDAGFRAAFAFGPWFALSDDPAELKTLLGGEPEVPFDIQNPREAQLRSAVYYLDGIQRPVFYLEGRENALPALHDINAFAAARRIPFSGIEVDGGDHFNILAPLTSLIARKLADAPQGDIHLTSDEVQSAFRNGRGAAAE